MPRERAARGLARCRRRLRLQGQALSGGDDHRLGGASGSAGRCAGSRRAPKAFVSDNQARDHRTHAELALDADGHFLALHVETVANLGAYVSTFGADIPSAIYSALLAGVYRTPAIFVESTGVFTNTAPTDAYRGAGRPEACYVLERLADRAAEKLGIDRAEIRRRNLIPPSAMPYKTPIGPTYDCGDFPKIFRARARARRLRRLCQRAARRPRAAAACAASAWPATSNPRASRRRASAARLARASASTRRPPLRVEPDGGVRAALGTHNHGQGHATTFAQILSSRLGVPVEQIEIIEGDTDQVPYGTGTFGSRSIAIGGSALDRAAGKIVDKGKLIAAHLLEAAAGDIEFADGVFTVAGTDRRVTFAEVARAAYTAHNYPPDDGAGPAGHRGLRSAELRLQQRRACLRGRDRSRHRHASSWSDSGRSTTSAP